MSNEATPASTVPTSSRVQQGDVIAEKYIVERVLAEGGMGVVVAAQHKQLRRRVALKFLLPDLCQMREVVARFLREAQAMTTIQNEHVARVLDVGTTAEGAPFMVMEYLEGEDLAQTLERRGTLPIHEAIEYVLQGMEALAEAHLHGFVHRDLKPSNLFVTQRPDGSPLVKVLDFGISKVAMPSDDVGGADLTHAHGLLGSPLYMSPEQIRSSKSVDLRADIWTLGIILYELFVGKPPFEGDSVPAVLAAIIADDPPSVRVARPDLPEAIANIIFKCLRRNRDERYATVADLARDLEPFATREGQLSVERIVRVVAHSQRSSQPMIDLKTPTPVKGVPVTKTPVLAGPVSVDESGVASQRTPAGNNDKASPLAATAHDPALVKQQMAQAKKGTEGPPSQGTEGTFGKYKLIAVLGQGGMADVFLAVLAGPEGLGFSKLVVIKRLRSNLAADPEFVSMLVDEARIAAKLNHPNVVQTHEVGVIDNEYYIAMEYLDGQPLNRIVQRTTRASAGQTPKDGIPLAFRLGIVLGMLAGVHHAHELADFDGTQLNLVHRDVTPQNVFVTYEGQVKVVDFGIAKARGRATETGQGIVKGKVAYMAPEQAGGKDIDRRADVFAAGVVLWELLTGERMWKGLDDVAIIQKLMLDKIPSSPRAVAPEIPKALDAIVKKALARKATDRYATAQEFQMALEHYMEAEGLKCTPRELGEFASSLFADRRKQTRSLIEAQLSALRTSGSRVLQAINLAEGGSHSASLTPGSGLRLERLDREPIPDDAISQRDPAMARSHPGQSGSTHPNTKSRWAFVAGVGAVLATLLIIGIVGMRKANPIEPTATSSSAVASTKPPPTTPTEPPPVNTPPPVVTNPQGANIQVVLTTTTAGAEFAIDEEPKAKAPINVARARDGKPHKITASAPGHKTETKTFTFDSDVSWTLQLAPQHGGAAPPLPASTKPTTSASVAAPATPAPTTSGKKKRELDDSPY